jgi:hypothetical protein
MGARMPMVLYVGRRPMRTVAAPMVMRDSTSIFLRPMRSPKWPNTTPPTGRARNPTPNVANDSRVPTRGLEFGKNSSGKTRAAAVP